MACPYFMPRQVLENGNWPHPARLPLGCGWTGNCTAPGHEGQTPSQETLESSCNLGYANTCSWTPLQRPWDAVRFAVSSPEDAKRGENAARSQTLRLIYICERHHEPASHGHLEYDLATATWSQGHEDSRIQKMAECFLESYLKKKA